MKTKVKQEKLEMLEMLLMEYFRGESGEEKIAYFLEREVKAYIKNININLTQMGIDLTECHQTDFDSVLRKWAEELMKTELKLTEKGKSYWNNTGAYQEEYKELYDKLVPAKGEAETLHGELLRAATRLMYEYYNNGNCNAKDYVKSDENNYCCYPDNDDDCEYDEDEDIVVSDFYMHFIDVLNIVPNVEEERKNIIDIIVYYDRYEDSEKNMYYEWMIDKVVHHILTTENSPLPEHLKFEE